MIHGFAVVVFVFALWCPSMARSQQVDQRPSSTSLGLASVGALSLHLGVSDVQRSVRGVEGGATLDLGHFASPRVRLLADVSFLRTSPMSERVESEGRSYRDVFYDLSGNLAVAVHPTGVSARIAPYVAAGVGIHVLSSSFGSLALDTRYNTNNFGVIGLAGVRARVGQAGRHAVLLEVRRIEAKDVSRLNLQVGMSALFNDLARR
jgi:outer membrane protein W